MIGMGHPILKQSGFSAAFFIFCWFSAALWKEYLDTRTDRLNALRDRLTDCLGCGCLSVERCSLRNPYDRLAEDGPGSRLLETDPRQRSSLHQSNATAATANRAVED
ncbi:hypothetical protein BN77_0532 [Rhizobium mesoamericanum STM3625]|uniref:Uncharacterized protein n=1 Tax=Rhizobium mesoamericanum STM3625 TaxID=1211777 RepID=K0PM85_9HYPH|nr:hypothetical protein BN77_0532 [Rhizobium mesoamericanum STM3625]